MTKEELEKAGYMFLITDHKVNLAFSKSERRLRHNQYTAGPSKVSIQYYPPWSTVSDLGLLLWEESMQVKNVGTVFRKKGTEAALVKAVKLATADWVLRRLVGSNI